jgi:hypothetical protein
VPSDGASSTRPTNATLPRPRLHACTKAHRFRSSAPSSCILLTDVAPVHGDLVRALGRHLPMSAIVGSTGESVVDAASLEATVRLAPSSRVQSDAADPIAITGSPAPATATTRSLCVARDDGARRRRHATRPHGAALHRVDPYARIVREQLSAPVSRTTGPVYAASRTRWPGRTLRALLALDATSFSRDAVIDLVSGAPIVARGSLVPATAWIGLSRGGCHRGVADWSSNSSDIGPMLAKRLDEAKADDASAGALAWAARQIDTVDVLDGFVSTLAEALAPNVRPRTWRGLAQWVDGLSGALLPSPRWLAGPRGRRHASGARCAHAAWAVSTPSPRTQLHRVRRRG